MHYKSNSEYPNQEKFPLPLQNSVQEFRRHKVLYVQAGHTIFLTTSHTNPKFPLSRFLLCALIRNNDPRGLSPLMYHMPVILQKKPAEIQQVFEGAERTRFELVVGLLLRQFSKLVVSATHPPLLSRGCLVFTSAKLGIFILPTKFLIDFFNLIFFTSLRICLLQDFWYFCKSNYLQ